MPPIKLRGPVPIMFEIPPAQRIETLHPIDAGVATARAATGSGAWGKVWLIGGGPRCQLTYSEYLSRFLEAMGMGGPLPEAAFTTSLYCTDWLDTEESQRAFEKMIEQPVCAHPYSARSAVVGPLSCSASAVTELPPYEASDASMSRRLRS